MGVERETAAPSVMRVRAIDVATLVADVGLHGARAFRTFEAIGDLAGGDRDVDVAAVAEGLSPSDYLMLFDDNFLDSTNLDNVLGFFDFIEHLKDGGSVARGDHGGAPADHCPSAFVLVRKHLLNVFCDGVDILRLRLVDEQALDAAPELRYDAAVFASLRRLPNPDVLNAFALEHRVVLEGCHLLTYFLDQLGVFSSDKEDDLLLLDLFFFFSKFRITFKKE